MGVFDFILALYSIIAGLAISVLVKGIARMIKGRESLHLYWVHRVVPAGLRCVGQGLGTTT
jgi:hypothetical protein